VKVGEVSCMTMDKDLGGEGDLGRREKGLCDGRAIRRKVAASDRVGRRVG
jgi:hypothetical protein